MDEKSKIYLTLPLVFQMKGPELKKNSKDIIFDRNASNYECVNQDCYKFNYISILEKKYVN